jgi:hypothetical protein
VVAVERDRAGHVLDDEKRGRGFDGGMGHDVAPCVET